MLPMGISIFILFPFFSSQQIKERKKEEIQIDCDVLEQIRISLLDEQLSRVKCHYLFL